MFICLISKLHRARPSSKFGYLSNTSTVWNLRCDGSSSGSFGDAEVLKIAEERSILPASKRARCGRGTFKQVDFAGPAQSRAALLVSRGIRRAEQPSCIISNYVLHVVEDIAFEDPASACITALEQVALDVKPHVVDGVQECLATKSRTASCSLGDVIVLHGDRVACADHLKDPVVVSVTASGVVRGAVDKIAR